jgi:hypothetical protein
MGEKIISRPSYEQHGGSWSPRLMIFGSRLECYSQTCSLVFPTNTISSWFEPIMNDLGSALIGWPNLKHETRPSHPMLHLKRTTHQTSYPQVPVTCITPRTAREFIGPPRRSFCNASVALFRSIYSFRSATRLNSVEARCLNKAYWFVLLNTFSSLVCS